MSNAEKANNLTESTSLSCDIDHTISTINTLSQFYFQWHFLDQCNLRCKHCYQNEHQAKPLSNLDLTRIAMSMEEALRVWGYIGRISLTGGEPFLYPDTLLSLARFFEQSDMFHSIGVLTNGTLLSSGIAQELKKLSKLREIQISLDGAHATTHDFIRGDGSFMKAIEGIRILKDAGIRTAIMFTLTKLNKCDAETIIDLALTEKVEAITIERATALGPVCNSDSLLSSNEIKSVFERVAARKKELGDKPPLLIRTSRPLWGLVDNSYGGFCPAGYSSLAILHDGTVLPCRRLNVPLGNVLNEGLFRIWYQSDTLWRLRNRKELGEQCRSCDLLTKCGGCRAVAYASTGDYMADDPDCWKYTEERE